MCLLPICINKYYRYILMFFTNVYHMLVDVQVSILAKANTWL